MKHNQQDLIGIAYRYFPRGISPREQAYEESPELRRQKEARVPASARYEEWRALLHRLAARFPPGSFPGVEVQNDCHFLGSPTAAVHLDRAYSATIHLPTRSPTDTQHRLQLAVSFVVPYYAFRSEIHGPLRKPSGELNMDIEVTFALEPDELRYAAAAEEEIRTTFTDHERLPPEVGTVVVPEVVTPHKWFGSATLFNCLFVDSW